MIHHGTMIPPGGYDLLILRASQEVASKRERAKRWAVPVASRYAPYPTEDPPSSPWWYCTRVRIGRYCHGSSIGHQPLCRHDVAPDLDLVSSEHLLRTAQQSCWILSTLYTPQNPLFLCCTLYCVRGTQRASATKQMQHTTHSVVHIVLSAQ